MTFQLAQALLKLLLLSVFAFSVLSASIYGLLIAVQAYADVFGFF